MKAGLRIPPHLNIKCQPRYVMVQNALILMYHIFLINPVFVFEIVTVFWGQFVTKRVFTWHWGDLSTSGRSLRFPLMALYLFTWYHHKMSCLHESLWREFTLVVVLSRSKNYTLVQNFAMVSCKRKLTNCFSVKSVCWWTGMGSSCIMFVILNCTCVLSTWSVPSNNWDMKWPIIM